MQKSAVWISKEFCEDFESKSGSEVFGLSTRQAPQGLMVQMGIYSVYSTFLGNFHFPILTVFNASKLRQI